MNQYDIPGQGEEIMRLKGMLPGRPLKVDHGRLCPCPDCEHAREADEIAAKEEGEE